MDRDKGLEISRSTVVVGGTQSGLAYRVGMLLDMMPIEVRVNNAVPVMCPIVVVKMRVDQRGT